MNGATAVLWARTSRAPNTNTIAMIGNSQNFLRARKNDQNSFRKLILFLLKLMRHGIRRRAGRSPFDPIASGLRIKAKSQGILAEEAHQEPYRCHDKIEQQTGDDRADDLIQ